MRAGENEACVAMLDEAFAKRPRDEWLRILREDSSDLIYTIVNSVDELRPLM